jgi:hypothetical protein
MKIKYYCEVWAAWVLFAYKTGIAKEGLFGKIGLLESIWPYDLIDAIAAKILRSFKADSMNIRASFFQNMHGLIGVKFFRSLIPPKLRCNQGISFRDIFYNYTIP